MRGIDHLRVRSTSSSGKLQKQVFPDAAARPSNEAIRYRRWRSIGFGTIAPTAAAFQHVHNTADYAAIVPPLDASNIRWQMRFNPLPLFVAQPK